MENNNAEMKRNILDQYVSLIGIDNMDELGFMLNWLRNRLDKSGNIGIEDFRIIKQIMRDEWITNGREEILLPIVDATFAIACDDIDVAYFVRKIKTDLFIAATKIELSKDSTMPDNYRISFGRVVEYIEKMRNENPDKIYDGELQSKDIEESFMQDHQNSNIEEMSVYGNAFREFESILTGGI